MLLRVRVIHVCRVLCRERVHLLHEGRPNECLAMLTDAVLREQDEVRDLNVREAHALRWENEIAVYGTDASRVPEV